jgi:hypothetical protein
VAHTRIIEQKGWRCSDKRHEVGARLSLWEILPVPDSTEAIVSQIEWP